MVDSYREGEIYSNIGMGGVRTYCTVYIMDICMYE